MKTVIIINGVAQSGKDTFVEYLRALIENILIEPQRRVVNISSIDYVKHVAEHQFGWNRVKNEKGRAFLSELKDAWTKYNNGPFHLMIDTIQQCTDDDIITVMCREVVEIGKLRNALYDTCKVMTLIVTRPNLLVPNNTGDKQVFNYTYDVIIHNGGDKANLKKVVLEFYQLYLTQ